MSDSRLRDRLREIGAVAPPDSHQSSVVSHQSKTSDYGDLATVLGGQWDIARHRFTVERSLSADAVWGPTTIGELADRLDRSAAGISLVSGGEARAPLFFFDLETTGLSGGAGTCAFLVGCGWFASDRSFVIRQHVLANYNAEPAMLAAVVRDFAGAGALVSFNGKSFDAPVLETRCVLHRLPWIGGQIPHVDMLYQARRFWGGSASRHETMVPGTDHSCSLTALERHVLGVFRRDDVPGFEIPGRYFQFLRTGDPQPLRAVLDHNRRDLISLAAVTARVVWLIDEGPEAVRTGREALAVGRAYACAGLEAKSRQAFERALLLAAAADVRAHALRSLALAERRARRYHAAAERWRDLLDLPGCPAHVACEAAEALAVHHEHRVRDLAAARGFVLETLKQRMSPSRSDAARHRLARIERKLGGASLFG